MVPVVDGGFGSLIFVRLSESDLPQFGDYFWLYISVLLCQTRSRSRVKHALTLKYRVVDHRSRSAFVQFGEGWRLTGALSLTAKVVPKRPRGRKRAIKMKLREVLGQ